MNPIVLSDGILVGLIVAMITFNVVRARYRDTRPNLRHVRQAEQEVGVPIPPSPVPLPVAQSGSPFALDYDLIEFYTSYGVEGERIIYGRRDKRYQNDPLGFRCSVGCHGWNLLIAVGLHRYQQCRRCGERRCVSYPGGYAPINRRWLAGESWRPPKGNTA